MSSFTKDQAAQLQEEVQRELERREWAEPNDLVMAEYICVLLANGSPRERVHAEMDDLVGSDFESSFLDWLFNRSAAIRATADPAPVTMTEPLPVPVAEAIATVPPTVTNPSTPITATAGPTAPPAGSRMFASAVEGTKRKADVPSDEMNKRRLPVHPGVPTPSGPRAMGGRTGNGGQNLADRLGPRGALPVPRGGMNVRGMANGRGGQMGMAPGGPMGFRPPPFGMPGFPGGGGFVPGQQEMMMQMMAMQANMAQMAEQMAKMSEGNANRSVRPPARPPLVKVPQGTKLGGHAVSSIQPRSSSSVGPLPDKPTSTALCKFGIGCSNARCPYSHPSPVADEKNGMVLSEEPCELGKGCKDPECIKSHISPAAVLGDTAGPSRLLCKYQTCTNPSCQYRHEDANGNLIPPPGMKAKLDAATTTRAVSEHGSDDLDVVVNSTLDGALDDTKTERPCRYGERCTRADCKFTHPVSRPTPHASKPFSRNGGIAGRHTVSGVGGSPSGAAAQQSITGSMGTSKKFSKAESKLNPSAGEFKPTASSDPELQVTF